jgi:exodeoxyribonuclease V alpha subunit
MATTSASVPLDAEQAAPARPPAPAPAVLRFAPFRRAGLSPAPAPSPPPVAASPAPASPRAQVFRFAPAPSAPAAGPVPAPVAAAPAASTTGRTLSFGRASAAPAPSAPAAAAPALAFATPAPAPVAAPAQASFGFGFKAAGAGGGAEEPLPLGFGGVNKPSPDETHVGIVKSVAIYGDWAVGSMDTQERESLKITGSAVAHLKEGLEYALTGRMKVHPSHGLQLDVVSFEPHIKPDVPSMARFIAANFTGIGKKLAEKFLTKVKEDGGDEGLEALRLKLVNEPWAVSFESVSSRKTTFGDKNAPPEDSDTPRALADSPEIPYIERMLATKFGALRELKAASLKLLAMNLFTQAKAQKDDDRPITEVATALLAKDPYSPMRTVPGYGFRSADAIGKVLNIPRDAAVRLTALASHLVTEECDSAGHVYVGEPQLRNRLAKTEPTISLETLIEYATESGDLRIEEDEQDNRRIYPAKLYDAEVRLAEDLHAMLVSGKPLLRKRTYEQFRAKALEVSQRLLGYELDEDQMKALYGIATSESRLHVVTAGPGCGKTAIMEVFSAMMSHKDWAFAAPTGKAAKVLSARVEGNGYNASTLHSLLKGSPEGGFMVNRNDPLSCQVLVVDEGTMPTLALFEAATAALPEDSHLIILGDPGVDGLAGQLPSIGAGRVLSDILRLPGVDHHHLTATKRNSGDILETVNQIRHYRLDCKDGDGVTFSHGLPPAESHFETVAAKYVERVQANGIENVMLLMSRRNGSADGPSWCTDYANGRLRDLLNPQAIKIPGTASLHVNDRIVIRDNMTLGKDEEGKDIRVVNGDTGTITRFQPHSDPKHRGAQYLVIKLDDGRFIQFPGDATKDLQHSYAATVHMSQGSEYKDVMLVMTPGQASFMNANMFLTGASRAREGLWIYGEDSDLRKIAATKLPDRNTTLVERVAEKVAETLRNLETAGADNDRPKG